MPGSIAAPPTTPPSLEQALTRIKYAVEPMWAAARRRGRLALFGFDGLDAVPCAEIDLQPAPADCLAECKAFVAAERRYLGKFAFRTEKPSGRLGAFWCLVPSVLDLAEFVETEDFLRRVRRHSKGGILRQIRRAREQGVVSRRIFGGVYARQLHDIQTSKRFRSGPVFAAYLRRRPPADFADGITMADIAAYLGCSIPEVAQGITLPPPPPPACAHHWNVDWGVFVPEEVRGDGGMRYPDRLVGYISLRRLGNVVRTTAIMGHGAYLAANVMKLLMCDVILWLIAAPEPWLRGVRYLHYGAIEHGNVSLVGWKRAFGFAPRRFAWRDPGGS